MFSSFWHETFVQHFAQCKQAMYGPFSCYMLHLEDHPRTCKWLISMVIVSPLSRATWDPFQMAELHGLQMITNGGDPNHLHPLV